MKYFVILITLVFSLFIISCGDTKTTSNNKQTATPSDKPSAVSPVNTPNPATTPNPESTKTPVDTGEAKITSAEEVVKQFMKACKEKDKATASKLAVAKVVDRFFSASGEASGLTFQGCEKEEKADKYNCTYSYEGGAMTFKITGNATSGFKIVAEEETAD
jgi:hypothetical protein